jgi:hypothetical protein
LTFSAPHVFKALQLLAKQKFVSRSNFSKELKLGEGAVKTLISHLKEFGMVESIKSGTFLTNKGIKFSKKFFEIISNECRIPKSSILESNNNHAIILRKYAHAIKSGVEQRDYAIMYGAKSAITLLYKNNNFMFPIVENPAFPDNKKIRGVLIKNLSPQETDVIIITSSNDQFVSEISAKNAALWTIAAHGNH